MDLPLTITSIMRYGTSVFGDAEVVTWTGDRTRRRTYAEAGRRAARLANALRGLGVDADQRVGTFMWNNAEHLEAYLAVPSMGAVLHTLNIRLAAAEVGYIATHAEDQVVIVDASLVPRFAEILPHAPTVKHVIVTGGPLAETPGTDQLTGVSVHRYEDLLARRGGRVRLAVDRRALRRGDVLHQRDHRAPEGHRLQPPVQLPALDGRLPRECLRPLRAGPRAARGAHVPRQRLGPGLRQPAVRGRPDHARPGPDARHAGPAHRRRARHAWPAGCRRSGPGVLDYVRSKGGDLSSLRLVVAGGSAVPHAMMVRFEKELGVRLLQAWGMTETSPLASVAHPPPA